MARTVDVLPGDTRQTPARRRPMRVEHLVVGLTLALFGALAASGLGRQSTEQSESVASEDSFRRIERPRPSAAFGGPVLSEPTSTVLFLVSNGHLARLDVDAGTLTTSHIRAAIDDSVHPAVLPRGDVLAFQGLDPEIGRTTSVVTLDLRAIVVPLGPSAYFVGASEEDRVVLAIPARGAVGPRAALSAVREVTVDGRILGPDTLSPEGWTLLAQLTGGLASRDAQGNIAIWDPASGNTLFSVDGQSIAFGSDRLAWCAADCDAVSVFDPTSDRAWEIRRPDHVVAFGQTGSFSPDGRYLAVPVGIRGNQGLRGAMAMVAVEEETAWVIPGSEFVPIDAPVAWSPAGDWVFFGRTGDYLGANRLGTMDVSRVPVDVGAVTSLAAI